ncbi:MAG: metallopeptidase family protein, partial [Alphaproteobacteria bacterium]
MAKIVGAQQRIIMNFTVPPGTDEMEEMAASVLESLPDEFQEYCEGLASCVEDFPDDVTSEELALDDSYDLLALYRSGKEISPGVERKTANDDDVLIVYRRPLLDMWCETGEDLMTLL